MPTYWPEVNRASSLSVSPVTLAVIFISLVRISAAVVEGGVAGSVLRLRDSVRVQDASSEGPAFVPELGAVADTCAVFGVD